MHLNIKNKKDKSIKYFNLLELYDWNSSSSSIKMIDSKIYIAVGYSSLSILFLYFFIFLSHLTSTQHHNRGYFSLFLISTRDLDCDWLYILTIIS